MEREEKKRRLGSSSTSEQLRLLIMGLRLMASQQLFSTQEMRCGFTTCWLSHLLITETCLTLPSVRYGIFFKQHAHRDWTDLCPHKAFSASKNVGWLCFYIFFRYAQSLAPKSPDMSGIFLTPTGPPTPHPLKRTLSY